MTTPHNTDCPDGAAPTHPETSAPDPVILARCRPDRTGHTSRTVHLAPLPGGENPSTLTTLCGTPLRFADIEQMTPGEGVPCLPCTVNHLAAALPAAIPPDPATPEPAAVPAPGPDAEPAEAAAVYCEWGWPVTLRRNQVCLRLGTEAVALMVPVTLSARVATVLTARRCRPAMLIHPYAPDHRVLLAGEPYPVALPWPPEVHRVTTRLWLPPTRTHRGPLVWARPPRPTSLTGCREIDVLAALRTALDTTTAPVTC